VERGAQVKVLLHKQPDGLWMKLSDLIDPIADHGIVA
jgi:hypothetical protein